MMRHIRFLVFVSRSFLADLSYRIVVKRHGRRAPVERQPRLDAQERKNVSVLGSIRDSNDLQRRPSSARQPHKTLQKCQKCRIEHATKPIQDDDTNAKIIPQHA